MNELAKIIPSVVVFPSPEGRGGGACVPPLKLFIVLGEPSGDALAASIVPALANQLNRPVEIFGLAGEKLNALGLESLFPISDIAVMGLSAVLKRLPQIYTRIYNTVGAIQAVQPDCILYCDSPDFCIRVARRVRKLSNKPSSAPLWVGCTFKKLISKIDSSHKGEDEGVLIANNTSQFWANVPQIKYICPSVWAWRPGRAKAMNGIYSQVLAILPFEPEVMQILGGPNTDYVGHPLLEKLSILQPSPEEFSARNADIPTIMVLPGSRMSEVTQLMPIFGKALEILHSRIGSFNVELPTVSHVLPIIQELAQSWKTKPNIFTGETEKYAAFRSSTVALAASGTVTLELALAHVPSIVAYKVDGLAALLRFLVKVSSIVLPNLIAGKNGFPEFIQEQCTPKILADALETMLTNQTTAALQLGFCADVIKAMKTDMQPSEHAAKIIANLLV